jgi:hypothetical protein
MLKTSEKLTIAVYHDAERTQYVVKRDGRTIGRFPYLSADDRGGAKQRAEQFAAAASTRLSH